MPDTFREKLEDIQKQIDQMGEKLGNAINVAHTAQMIVNNLTARVLKIEQENSATDAHDMPDSEGFWRDSDGDVWVRDTVGNTLLIAAGHRDSGNEIYGLPSGFNSDSNIQEYGPYVKIDNPFIQGEDHAD